MISQTPYFFPFGGSFQPDLNIYKVDKLDLDLWSVHWGLDDTLSNQGAVFETLEHWILLGFFNSQLRKDWFLVLIRLVGGYG